MGSQMTLARTLRSKVGGEGRTKRETDCWDKGVKQRATCQQKDVDLSKHFILSCLEPSHVLIDDLSRLFIISKLGNSGGWWGGAWLKYYGKVILLCIDTHSHTHFEVFSHLTPELCLLMRPIVFHILWNLFNPSAPWPYFHLSFLPFNPSFTPFLPTQHTHLHTQIHTLCWEVKRTTPAVTSPSNGDQIESQ